MSTGGVPAPDLFDRNRTHDRACHPSRRTQTGLRAGGRGPHAPARRPLEPRATRALRACGASRRGRDRRGWGVRRRNRPPYRAQPAEQELFVRDLFAGADVEHRFGLRFVTPNAWHALFVYNMFLRPSAADLAAFTPVWTVHHAPEFHADPAIHGTKSGTFVVIHFSQRTILIGGTRYAGEMKKSVFTILNYLLPKRGVLSMHCSANLGRAGDVALFFGLSGTGKTTLSADPER